MKSKILIVLILSYLGMQKCYADDLIIAAPGIYVLGDSIVSLPTAASNVISVQSSDVVLDLGGYVVSLGNAQAGVIGININANLTDIVIQNGTVRSMTGTGILINSGCARLRMNNIIMENVNGSAVLASGAAASTINDIELRQSRFFNCGTTGVTNIIAFSNCSRLQMSDCIIANTINTTGTLNAILVNQSTMCDFTNITIQNIATPSGGFNGIAETTNNNSAFAGITIRNNIANGPLTCFSLSSSNNIYSGCLATGNVASAGPFSGVLVSGATSLNNLFSNVNFISNTANQLNSINAAFNIGSAQQTLLDCNALALNTSLAVSTTNLGYLLTANNQIIVRCIGSNISSTAGTASAGQGLNANATNTSVIVDCLFSKNTGSTTASGKAVNVISGANNLFARNIGFVCDTSGTGQATQFRNVPAGSVITTLASPQTSNLNSTTLPWSNLSLGS
ncbi:hypothetical protein HYX58_00150 [Candidatus Dependentiae bacterium]|nr:hypothetical protein [Candidatus Dependentiae bacterium]